jgi:hypothetical protein
MAYQTLQTAAILITNEIDAAYAAIIILWVTQLQVMSTRALRQVKVGFASCHLNQTSANFYHQHMIQAFEFKATSTPALARLSQLAPSEGHR